MITDACNADSHINAMVMLLLPCLYRTSLAKLKRGDGDNKFELDMFKQEGGFRACYYEGRLHQPMKMSVNCYKKVCKLTRPAENCNLQ